MAKQVKPKCFVAMAFDKDDTDILFEKSILPVLKSNHVTPIIINRREDNRDINQQIIEQLNECDFAIADLTYTRPSVYFEAGYAQCRVEVVYTVRSDHLNKNQPEDMRVHFDLQMKPILKWTNPDSQEFRAKLEKRLRSTILRNWNRTRAKQEGVRVKRDEFAHMPLNEKLKLLRKEMLSGLCYIDFKTWEVLIPNAYLMLIGRKAMIYKRDVEDIIKCRWIISKDRQVNNINMVSLRTEETLSLKKLRDEVYKEFVASKMLKFMDEYLPTMEPCSQSIEHHVLCSIKPLPRSRIMSAMPTLRWDSELQCYATEVDSEQIVHAAKKSLLQSFDIKRHMYFHFIENVQSIPECQAELKNLIQNIKQINESHI